MTRTNRFLLLLLVSLIIQAALWRNTVILDVHPWSHLVTSLAKWDDGVFNEFTQGYPNTPVLMLAVTAYRLFGIPAEAAFAGALAVIIATLAALTGMICYYLRPNILWWVAAPLMLSFNSLLPSATPPTAVVAVALVPLALFALLLLENKYHSLPRRQALLFGALFGFCVASRFDFALAIGLPLVVAIASRRGWHMIGWIVLSTLVSFLVLDPFMWFMPAQHLTAMVHKLSYHALHYTDGKRLAYAALPQYIAFGLFGVALAVCSAIVPKLRVVSRLFLGVMFAVTFGLTIGLSLSAYQPIWYTLPSVVFWEIMAPLFILNFARYFTPPPQIANQKLFLQSSQVFITLIFVAGFAALFAEHLTLPW